jgi:serine/threonine-protein kinase
MMKVRGTNMIGLEIGSYKLVSKIGEGGMGAVYLAEHKLLPRKAAVKVLLKEFSEDENMVKRFINEAKATSQIVHPGIVQIFDFGTAPDGSTYMIMEYLEGETLYARIRKRGRLPLAEAISIVRQMAEALNVAHKRRVVHRDLKPENMFLVADPTAPNGERVKLLDFGIAKLLDPTIGSPRTRTGNILGTPLYMSPEQCRAATQIDHRADIYALGCVFFHLLCGRPPFAFDGVGELLGAHVYTPAPAPSSVVPSVPRGIDAVVLKMLAKQPDDRYPSMKDLVTALDDAPLDAPENAAAFSDATVVDGAAVPVPAPVERSGPEAATVIGRPQHLPVAPPASAAQLAPAPTVVATPPPVVAEPPSGLPPTTTLGGAAGESTRPPALPQLERKRPSSLVTMGIAFGITLVLAIGAFFLFGRGGGSDPTPAVPAQAPPPIPATVENDAG